MPLRVHWMVAALLIAGCYTPHDATVAEGDGGSSDSSSSSGGTSTGATTTASTTTASTTTSPSTTDGETSSETAADTGEDLPPVLSEFSVNGSEMPAEILEAEIVEIQVAADDDVGIDRVEFYDGETLLATFTEPPYITEVLVTSADNGGHSYTALAWDTAEQMAEAGPIPLSVGIDGGAVLELQDVGFDAVALLGIGPHLVATDSHLNVIGSELVDVGMTSVARIAVSRRTFGLSSSGTDYYPVNVTAQTPDHTQIGHGVLDDSGGVLLPAIVGDGGALSSPLSIFRSASGDGALSSELDLGADSTEALGGLARNDDGLAATSGRSRVTHYDWNLDDDWTTELTTGLDADALITAIAMDAEGSVVTTGSNGGDGIFVRKLSNDGSVLWTRTFAEGSGEYSFVAASTTGEVAVVSAREPADGGGVRFVVYDTDGTEIVDTFIAAGDDILALGLAYDASNHLVVAGRRNDGSNDAGWVARYTNTGDEIWYAEPDLGSGQSLVSGIAALPDGRLYTCGLRNAADDFLITTGDAWVAELAL